MKTKQAQQLLHAANRRGLTLRKLITLLHLRKTPDGTATVGSLAELVGTSRAALTGMTDSMEKAGLILRRHGRSDRRNIMVTITGKGSSIADEVVTAGNENTPPLPLTKSGNAIGGGCRS